MQKRRYDPEKRRRRYLEHKERELARQKKYNQEHEEQLKAYQAEYYHQHRDKIIKKSIENRKKRQEIVRR